MMFIHWSWDIVTSPPKNCTRRDKLNSQFIVTNILILHAEGQSLFRFQISKRVRETLGRTRDAEAGVFIQRNGTMEWNGGMERWNGMEWNSGMTTPTKCVL